MLIGGVPPCAGPTSFLVLRPPSSGDPTGDPRSCLFAAFWWPLKLPSSMFLVGGRGWCGCCKACYSGGRTDVVGTERRAWGFQREPHSLACVALKLPSLCRCVGSPSNPRASGETTARRLRPWHRCTEPRGKGRIGWFVCTRRCGCRKASYAFGWTDAQLGRSVGLGDSKESLIRSLVWHKIAVLVSTRGLSAESLSLWRLGVSTAEALSSVSRAEWQRGVRRWLDRCCRDVSSGLGIPKRALFVCLCGIKLPCLCRCVGSPRNPCGVMIARRPRPGRRRPCRGRHALPERPSLVPLAFSSPRYLSRLAVRARSRSGVSTCSFGPWFAPRD